MLNWGFQSLFFWIHFYNPRGLQISEDSLAVFQSLFFWIHFYNLKATSTIPQHLFSFNPCFSGFTSTTALATAWTPPELEVSILVFLDSLLQRDGRTFYEDVAPFQSLFFWIHFYNHTEQYNASASTWFQSLFFLDSLLQLGDGRTFYEDVAPFQSLFFWIHFYNARWCWCWPPPPWFQSLFFWIHFYNPGAAWPTTAFCACFNPCFSGFTSTTLALTPPSRAEYRVSILVFLDSLLQRQQSHKYF